VKTSIAETKSQLTNETSPVVEVVRGCGERPRLRGVTRAYAVKEGAPCTTKTMMFSGILGDAPRDGGGQVQWRWRRVLIVGYLRLRIRSTEGSARCAGWEKRRDSVRRIRAWVPLYPEKTTRASWWSSCYGEEISPSRGAAWGRGVVEGCDMRWEGRGSFIHSERE
jgi:hypothetical protein